MKRIGSLFLVALVAGQAIVNGQDFSDADIQSIVTKMNGQRASVDPPPATNIAPLTWSSDLAANAAALAKKCGAPMMSDAGAGGQFSESIFFFSSQPNPDSLINSLANSKSHYLYDDQVCEDGFNCIDYTNMIWDHSTQVGCSTNLCSSGPANGKWVTVCNWNPPGSFAGVFPYKAAPHTMVSKLSTDPTYHGSANFESNKMLALNNNNNNKNNKPGKAVTKAKSFDFRTLGIVPSADDSVNCSASYAFTAVAIAQTRVALRESVRPGLSVQQVIDCSKQNHCNGGNVNDALIYIRDIGLMNTFYYPYQGSSSDGTCKFDPSRVVMSGGFVSMSEPGKDNILAKARKFGPVGVSMLTNTDFYDYRSGIFSCDQNVNAADTNHSVLLVGYNDENNYYIIRNNFGVGWGQSGFAFINADENHDCGISKNRAASLDTNDL